MTEHVYTPDEQLALDFITTAVEGGINYWADVRKYRHEDRAPDDVVAVVHESGEEDDLATHTVTIKLMMATLERIENVGPPCYSQGYQRSLQDRLRLRKLLGSEYDFDFDADDADCAFQCAVFDGELVYG